MREKGALLALLAGCGLTLTLYTLYVELQHERNRNYKALCDINEHMSCTKAFTSRYGKGFGLFDTQSHFNIPNPVYGVIFYTTQLLICGFASSNLITNQIFMLLSLISNLLSLYLAYILFLLKTICIVCVALYTINFAMLIASIRRVNDIKKRKAKQE